ncbi:hypothetical protein MRX96_058993 [Rhipicephalus microplus]
MADNKFLPNGDNPRRARHFQSVAPTHRMNNSRGPTKDVLTGFDCPFLDSRSITFAYPLSNGRVCAGCSMVPAIAVRLPCAHILCGSCALDAVARLSARATAANHDGLCPEEGAPFLKSELGGRDLPRGDTVEPNRVVRQRRLWLHIPCQAETSAGTPPQRLPRLPQGKSAFA